MINFSTFKTDALASVFLLAMLYYFYMKPYGERTHSAMKDVLMNPEAKGPDIHYYMIRGGSDKRNITTWETGTVGGEYIKAYGHYHIDDFIETYWIIEGEGILLLQMRKKDPKGNWLDDELEYVKAIRVKAGDSYAIPPFAGHLMINTGTKWLTTSDDSPVSFDDNISNPRHADYAPVKRMHGFAYYAIEKDGTVAFVPNPHYKNPPPFEVI
jgi:oxalate decarboxylase/phosphoglucose isomerase-like protein (cupin superfamily)